MNRVRRFGIVFLLTMTVLVAVCRAQNSLSPESQRRHAIALEQMGRNAEAELAWREFLRIHPRNPEAYAHLGLLEARKEHYKEAVDLDRKALAIDPTIPGLRLNFGLALFKSNNLTQAILEFKMLLRTQRPASDEFERLTILIGMAHYGLGEYAEAVPYLQESATSDSGNLQLRLALAHSCLWSRQYQCVLDEYHEMLTLNAESAEVDMLAGEAMDELKQYDGAIQQFRAAEKVDPRQPDVHFGLGYLLWTQRQYPEAAQEFRAELGNNPNHVQAMAYLADTQMQLNHPEVALPLLLRVERYNPALSLGHLDLGILYTDGGRWADALRELRAAARLAPEDMDAHWRLARLYKAMGKKTEEKAEFEKTSSLHKLADDALINKISGGRVGAPKPGEAAAQAADR